MFHLIPERDGDLLAECDIEVFCAGGPGGQHVNRRRTAVRLRHRPTGLVVACQRERSQSHNRRIALEWLREKLQRRNRRRRPRIPTKMPQGIRRAILRAKRRRGEKKRLRCKPGRDEE